MTNTYTENRFVAIDWMRGLVMMLMALDHASAFYNPGRLALDSAATYSNEVPLPLDQFLTRWITHLCAPTFVFLAGTSLALSCHQRRLKGISEQIITRDIWIRGVIIAAFDIIWVSYVATDGFLLQVLYAIGLSMIIMAWLRLLNYRLLFSVAVLWFLCGELLTCLWWDPPEESPSLWLGLTMAPYYSDRVVVIYPVIPWLAVMMIGWVFGCCIKRQSNRKKASHYAQRTLLLFGVLLLVLFILIRSHNGYGNMLLPRVDDTLAQWLHVSKYPPGLSYILLELGLMAIVLSLFFWMSRRTKPSDTNPFLVFGQTALFFYILHLAVLGTPAVLLNLTGKGTLIWAYVSAVIALIVLYPVCWWYRQYKAMRPNSWVRFI